MEQNMKNGKKHTNNAKEAQKNIFKIKKIRNLKKKIAKIKC